LISYARTGNPTLTHSYNGLDDRVSTTTGTDTRRFVYAPDGRVLGEYGTSATDVKAEFIWLNPQVGDGGTFGGDDGLGGYMPLAVVTTGGTLSWVHGDHLGTPILMTNAAGTAIAQPSGYTPPAFPGQSKTLADLYYNRHRDYDPTTGRYIQADPIGLAGGPSPYSYAMNNPLRYTDPEGLNPVIAGRVAWGVGVVVGQGLFWWCRSNMALCMRTVGPPAIRVAKACQAISNVFREDNDPGDDCDIEYHEEMKYCSKKFGTVFEQYDRCTIWASTNLGLCKAGHKTKGWMRDVHQDGVEPPRPPRPKRRWR
jgi:RHS repeat-associated protein